MVLLAAFGMGQAPGVSGQTIFSDGFESGDASSWSGCVSCVPVCPVTSCTVVTEFPFQVAGDTSISPHDSFDAYSCAPARSEAGPEDLFLVAVSSPGTLVATVEGDGFGEDLDVQILSSLDPNSCLAQGDSGASSNLPAGTAFVVVDSRSDGATAYEGSYTLTLRLLASNGNCGMLGEPISRSGGAESLAMPVTGPTAKLGHLVTAEEWTGIWPITPFDGIASHYTASEAATGYAMTRGEGWRPCCEPANEWGQGATGSPLPATAEGWYVAMLWATRPASGTRYLAFEGTTGRAVVVAAGYDVGPGNPSQIGGLCEEVHDYLGTGHMSHLTLGVAVNQSLPFGPIACEE